MAKLNCVTVLAPAKLNLALDVVGLLPNGYHNLDMTMQAITLYERVVLRRSQNLSLTLPGSPVAANDSNTAIKAALAFFHYTGLLAGVEITIYKNVPVRAGMAGGSADAAGVLVGLNVLYGAKLSMSELCALGAKIGADVPFALMPLPLMIKWAAAPTPTAKPRKRRSAPRIWRVCVPPRATRWRNAAEPETTRPSRPR